MKRLRAATGPVHGVVSVPGSKSIANRALAAAALADGDSHLSNVPDGDDTVAMVRCLAGLGIGVEARDDGGRARRRQRWPTRSAVRRALDAGSPGRPRDS